MIGPVEEIELSAQEQAELWQKWVNCGPQGPISDEDAALPCQDPESSPLTSSQREELDRRLDELEDEGPTGLSWDEAVAQSRARSR